MGFPLSMSILYFLPQLVLSPPSCELTHCCFVIFDTGDWSLFKQIQVLVLEYDKNSDSVLEVVESDYNGCSRGNPVKEFHDGNTKIQLDRSGPFYFISGADGHCEKGEKLIVRVLAANHTSAGSHSPAPAPSPSTLQHAPAPAAATGAGHALKLGFMGWLALIAASLIFVFAMA